MAGVFASTIPGARAGALAMATPSAARSFPTAIDQHQTWGHAGFAFRASTPAAVNQLQDRSGLLPARAGILRVDALTNGPVRSFSSLRIGFHLRGRAMLAAPRLFHFCARIGSRRSVRQSLRDQQPIKFARHAEILHPTNRLSNPSSRAGSTTSARGLPWNGKSLCNRCKRK